jgi:APA family basic amino acid/polyamine antiporter
MPRCSSWARHQVRHLHCIGDIARQLGSAGWLLLAWVVTGLLTVAAALSYGELAAMMPRAGGQYVYLREAFSPLWGFLYGWTLFLVIQTGTIAAVAVGFSRFLGVIIPAISPTAWIIQPVNLSTGYAISLSLQQLLAILLIVFLTLINTRGLNIGKWIQNIFTSAKTLSLLALILLGILAGRNAEAISTNSSEFWAIRGVSLIHPDVSWLPSVSATDGLFGLLVAFCVPKLARCFLATPGTTSPSPPVRCVNRNGTFRSRWPWEPGPWSCCFCWPTLLI